MIQVFSTAEGLLTQDDRVTAHGLQEVFATNVFGHFILVNVIRPHSAPGPEGWAHSSALWSAVAWAGLCSAYFWKLVPAAAS